MKLAHLVRFGFIALALLLTVLFIGPAAGVRAQGGGPAAGDPAASQSQAPAAALGTSFTYQGRLTDGATQANGAYDFQFKLFDAASGGTQIGSAASKNDLPVSGGLFTADLDFGAGAFDGQARWLEVAVRPGAGAGAYTALAPRRALLASPYATYSNNTRGLTVADNGWVGINSVRPAAPFQVSAPPQDANGRIMVIGPTGPDDGASLRLGYDFSYGWIQSGNSRPLAINPEGNNVGIGTTDPQALLQILPTPQNTNCRIVVIGPVVEGAQLRLGYQSDFACIQSAGSVPLAINPDGNNVGIGTKNPQALLDVAGTTMVQRLRLPGDRWDVNTEDVDVRIGNDTYRLKIGVAVNGGGAGDVRIRAQGGSNRLMLGTGDKDAVVVQGDGSMWVDSTTSTRVLQIRGGADLAERFQQTGDAPAGPGTVMVIDEANPGHLKVSEAAYDTKVAGIVSGAGDIKPGLTLSQEGVLEGDLTVAMAGRVYARCEATSSPIQPGDLLTTSGVPGHCMKAVDKERRDGAMLGKAMTGLVEGTGLVLVLVNLQ